MTKSKEKKTDALALPNQKIGSAMVYEATQKLMDVKRERAMAIVHESVQRLDSHLRLIQTFTQRALFQKTKIVALIKGEFDLSSGIVRFNNPDLDKNEIEGTDKFLTASMLEAAIKELNEFHLDQL